MATRPMKHTTKAAISFAAAAVLTVVAIGVAVDGDGHRRDHDRVERSERSTEIRPDGRGHRDTPNRGDHR